MHGTAVQRSVRAVVVVMVALVALTVLAAPAQAHGRGSDATDFDSRVRAAPALDGVSWRIYGGDELLWVGNDGSHEVTVLGYSGEPYLRIGPDGVFENRRSPASYLNQDRYRTDVPPDVEVDPEAEPDWMRLGGGTSHAWHDHRTHWMSPQLPPIVEGADEPVHIQDWEVPIVVDGEQLAVAGDLWWVPGPAPWPWLAVALLLTLPALAGLRTRPAPDPDAEDSDVLRWPGLARPAAVVLAGVSLLNLSHLVDDLVAVPLPLPTVALAVLQTLLFSGIGLFGAWRAWQGGDGAFTALGVGSGAILLGQGLLYIGALTASQLATVSPDWMARGVVALSLVQFVPVGLVAFIGIRRLLPDLDEPSEQAPAAQAG